MSKDPEWPTFVYRYVVRKSVHFQIYPVLVLLHCIYIYIYILNIYIKHIYIQTNLHTWSEVHLPLSTKGSL